MAFDTSDPALTAEIPGDMLARARAISDFTLPGLPPARIVQLADEKVAREAQKAQEGRKAKSETPDVAGKSTDEGEGGKLPIIQADQQKPAADPFQLTPEQEEKARQTIAIVDNQGADKLDRAERITALEYLRGKPNLTSQERKTAITIFRTIPPDPAFEAQEEPNRKRLLKQLPKDEIIKNAEKNWPRLTPEEKLAALDQAVAIYATIFEIEKPKVRLKDLGFSGAQHDQRTNTISIELGGILAKEDPGLAFGNIIHEATHAQQRQSAEAFSAGKIKPGDSRWLQAKIFLLNSDELYFSLTVKTSKLEFSKETKDYRGQPVEVHARDLSGRVESAFRELFQRRMKRELGR